MNIFNEGTLINDIIKVFILNKKLIMLGTIITTSTLTLTLLINGEINTYYSTWITAPYYCSKDIYRYFSHDHISIKNITGKTGEYQYELFIKTSKKIKPEQVKNFIKLSFNRSAEKVIKEKEKEISNSIAYCNRYIGELSKSSNIQGGVPVRIDKETLKSLQRGYEIQWNILKTLPNDIQINFLKSTIIANKIDLEIMNKQKKSLNENFITVGEIRESDYLNTRVVLQKSLYFFISSLTTFWFIGLIRLNNKCS